MSKVYSYGPLLFSWTTEDLIAFDELYKDFSEVGELDLHMEF